MSTTTTDLSLEQVRARFPSLSDRMIYLDNAGGSQVPACVADAVRDFMLTSNAQIGAAYETSRRCARTWGRAHEFLEAMFNAEGVGRAIIGPSTSALMRMLAHRYADALDPAIDQIIIAQANHESNISPWDHLRDFGYDVRFWRVDPETQSLRIEDLEPMLDEQTRLVAVPHVSNVLGEVMDVRAIAELVHEHGARIVVDGVACVPHRAPDVKAWNVDWYVYSAYKVFGPHVGALYGRNEALAEITGPGHFFIPDDAIPTKFELGSGNYEGAAGLIAVYDHLCFLAGAATGDRFDRAVIERAYDVMAALELPLQDTIIEYLEGRPGVRIVGPGNGGDRVGTISFVHESTPSAQIAAAANARQIGIKHGHFCSYRLIEALGIDPADGVVRTSVAHYNSPDEIQRLIELFDDVL